MLLACVVVAYGQEDYTVQTVLHNMGACVHSIIYSTYYYTRSYFHPLSLYFTLLLEFQFP